MLINFVGRVSDAPSLTLNESRAILQFCRSIGASLFTVNFVFVKGEGGEQLMQKFYERLSPFSRGEKDLENAHGDGFSRQSCWRLDQQSEEVILKETSGNLFAYDVPNLPEDWLFYIDDFILLQVITHEQEATLRVSEDQYAEFKKLGVAHSRGCPKWSGLPQEPVRAPRLR